MDKKDSVSKAMIKAKELSDAIRDSYAFKEKDAKEMQNIIRMCNEIIVKTTKLNYGAICQPRSGCCG